jgi:hypothetical protein
MQFYIEQGPLTDPGEYHFLFEHLPTNAFRKYQLLQNIILHHADAKFLNLNLPADRLSDLQLRSSENMLKRIYELCPYTFIFPREPQERLIGCCRDFSVLLCSIFRHQKIPARLRYGFSTYHIPGFYHDQVYVEYWNEAKQRWCLADVRSNAWVIKAMRLNIDFDLFDVPREKFFTAGEAWYLCRTGQKHPHQFGTGIIKRLTGLWYIRNKLIQDLASLNKMEMLLWDLWGYMLKTLPNMPILDQQQLKLFDQIAEQTRHFSVNFFECRSLYLNDKDLQPLEFL